MCVIVIVCVIVCVVVCVCVREWMQADSGRASFWRGMGDMWGLPWPRDCEFGSAQPVDAAVERSFSRRCTPRVQCVEDLEYRNRLIASSFATCCPGLLSYPFCPDDYPADFRISQLRFAFSG